MTERDCPGAGHEDDVDTRHHELFGDPVGKCLHESDVHADVGFDEEVWAVAPRREAVVAVFE